MKPAYIAAAEQLSAEGVSFGNLYFSYYFSFVETPRKFIIAIINLRGVHEPVLFLYSVDKCPLCCAVFAMQTYKELIVFFLSRVKFPST